MDGEDIMGAVSDVVESVSDVVGGAVDIVSDAGSWIDDNVLQPALDDPIVTAAKIAAVASGNSWALPIIEGADTAAEGGDIGDIALSAAKSYAGGEISSGLDLGSTDFDLGSTDFDLGSVGDFVSDYGDQIGDFPIEGNYGNPLGSGVQDAVQNLLDNNALQQISGVIPPTLGDQAGDYPLEGNYGNPLAEGVSEATKNLLDYNANYANPSFLSNLNDITKGLSGNKQIGSGNTAYLLAKGLSGGQGNAPIGYNMNQNPFSFTAQQPIQGTYNPQPSPLNITDQTKNLANLLRNT